MKQYICTICGYVHDEATAGKWEDLPADWKCPICGAGKDAFKVKQADEDGFHDLAAQFRGVAAVEKAHEGALPQAASECGKQGRL